ncbi:Nramp family divalent metal transporter [Achromobacter arsenitoxydans]|uniref:Natural resistance-associated macrophage family protein n=1 Tax=Achromobacter arsenitoxydans SY8 TaxID=477184 RepID=H0FEN4_9BURK|nr:Nramp family divalent metal transporter [Achromobacter arsenitoxydans]EHK63270.1 natural resistance-associated macrophage family protein [Achromobacter arsenitoxydans SY8]
MTGFIYAISGGNAAVAHDARVTANLRRMVGSGILVAVGYIDPGNWATDIAGGSGFGYGLLMVVITSAFLALGFQVLVSRLALATGEDLATLTARHLSPRLSKAAWVAGEAAILATALAELIGGAIALRLLFGLPLIAGVAVTGIGTFAVLTMTRGNADRHERVIALLLSVVALSFVFLLFKANPAWTEVAHGVTETGKALRDPQGFLIALGILGATLMPHNLYLHSGSLAQRARDLPADARGFAMRVARNDTIVSLGVAMLINSAIMIVAAASLSGSGMAVSSLDDAHAVIGHTLGVGAAVVFAVALYAAGQSSTITGVLAGRILSRGFQVRSNWSDRRRALATRLVAGLAAVGLLAFTGGQDPDGLLVLSQVILSLALPFALGPLVVLACRKSLMGQHVLRGAWAWAAIGATVSIIVLDGYLLVDMVA